MLLVGQTDHAHITLPAVVSSDVTTYPAEQRSPSPSPSASPDPVREEDGKGEVRSSQRGEALEQWRAHRGERTAVGTAVAQK